MADDNRCDTCRNLAYDEEYDEYVCMMDMDEDDYAHVIMGGNRAVCPYYDGDDEYKIVRHQM